MNSQIRNEIVRRWYGGQSMRGVAREMKIARKTVRVALDQHEQQRQQGAVPAELQPLRTRRGSLIDPHVERIQNLLARYPKITVRRIWEELQGHGYTGGYSILCERVAQLRPQLQPPWIERFETGPGVQAQMDYAVYTLDFTQEGRRRVNLFSLIFSYSRRQYLRFVESQDMETTQRQHIRAFEHLGGVTATCLYDCMKVVVSRHEDDQPIYNPRFLAFATHYGYRPVACRPRRPQTKGKVERPFQYVESSLLGGREFRSLEHLNEVTAWWLENVADTRVHGQTRRRPIDLHAEELPHLIPLPAQPYDVAEVVYRTVDEEGYVPYGSNRYSVPWSATRPGQLLPIKITEDTIIIYGPHLEEIARHARFPATVTHEKSRLAAHRPPRDQQRRRELLKQRYQQLGEEAVKFLEGLLQSQRNGWQQAEKVLALLATYRTADFQAALDRAVRYGAFSLSAMQRILAAQAQPKSCLELLAEEAAQHIPDILRTPATLRVPLSGEQLDQVLRAAEQQGLSHLEFLQRLVGTQAQQRRERAVERRICEACFREVRLLEDFDWEFNAAAIDRVQIEQLATGEFLRRGEVWADYLDDPALAMALMDRVVDSAIRLNIDGKSYRVHRAQRAKPPSQETKS